MRILRTGLLTILCLFTLYCGISLGGATGVIDSKHDLRSSSFGNSQFKFETDYACVFCHTPHNAESGVRSTTIWDGTAYVAGTGSPIYLWNRSLPAMSGGATYLTYYSSTFDADTGTGNNDGDVRVMSLLCLSCHDGVSALNVVTNDPPDATSPIPPDPFGSGADQFSDVFTGGAFGWGPNIGQRTATTDSIDLRNDHPISIDYDTNLVSADGGGLHDPSVLAGTGLQLFYSTITGANTSLECPTCHDVHNEGSGDTYPFLVMSNSNSQMCTTCHNK